MSSFLSLIFLAFLIVDPVLTTMTLPSPSPTPITNFPEALTDPKFHRQHYDFTCPSYH